MLLTADNKPAFPNAEILVPESEWKFWSDEGNLSRMTAGSIPEINLRMLVGFFRPSTTE
jgi:hypothetical protein